MNLLEVRLDKLLEILGTDPDLGLTGEQVLQNRREFGENVLYEKKSTALGLIKKIFGDVMMILFLLISLFQYLETGNVSALIALIAVSVLYSSFVLGAHVYVARTRKRLEKYSRSKYHVKRAGRIRSVEKSELVPGDILYLEKGDVVPCDGIILRHSALKILEASVTDRRVPVFKRSHEEVEEAESAFPYFECILFAGSVILHGSVKVFVCNTGKNIFDSENAAVSRQNTSIPKIYEMALELKKQISLIWVVSSFFLLAWGVFCGQLVFDTFYFVAALIVTAFPDSIEHLCSLALAHMTRKLFREGVYLRNPGAIDRLCDANCVFVNSSEYLFYAHPIANAFYLGRQWYDFKKDAKKASPLLEDLLLSQSGRAYYLGKEEEWKAEKAILAAAASVGIQKTKLHKAYLHINHYDFDPRYGYACSLVMKNGVYRLVIRGNPNSVLPACSEIYQDGKSVPMNESVRASLRSDARHLAGMCERMVAVAEMNLSSPSTGDQRSLCRGMTYLGMFGLSTPISADAANAVSVCHKSGVQTYLLTDDYPETVSALSKSVSIIGEGDYQYALSYSSYERMDRGVFVADIEKYKAYCNFPIHEKQNIVRYHKNNGNITVTLTSGVLDTLTQMESDISIVGAEEKLNAVRLNADLLVKEKRYELIPLCINWARIFYRNIVHIMQYILLLQVSLGVCAFIGVTANHAFPFDPLPMLFMGIGTCIPAAINIYHRVPGSRLEDNQGVLKDDRVASLQVLIIIPLIAGAIQALSVMLSRQIAYFATQDPASAAACATFTFIFASYFSSLSLKFDSSLFKRLKEIGRSGLVTGLICAAVSILLCLSPLQKLWLGGKVPVSPGVWTVVLALLLSVLPLAVLEGLKLLNKEDPAKERDS